jgi:hypothetical protein
MYYQQQRERGDHRNENGNRNESGNRNLGASGKKEKKEQSLAESCCVS